MACRVLVVDDSRMQRRILSAQLARSGYIVTEADSAEEALALCREAEPDIVLSDWMMDGMTGVEFCRAFRQMKRKGYGYFVLLTSKTEKHDVTEGLDSGADDFLAKPVNGSELRARLAAGERILRMQRELQEKNRLLRRAQEAIERDLSEARKLQQSLVKERHRSFVSGEVSLLLRPAGQVGGDLVGFFPINAQRVALFGLDVSGHGITSAMMTARLAGYLSGASPDQNIALIPGKDGAYDGRDPAELAAHLNRLLLDDIGTENYFTLIYADLDLVSGEVAMVQAGHPHPALQHADGAVEFLGGGGMPVGLLPGASYETTRVTLVPGDRLFLMSDGITEAMSQDGMMLGEAGLSRMMRHAARQRGSEFLDSICRTLAAYTEGELLDDVSAVFFEFHGTRLSQA